MENGPELFIPLKGGETIIPRPSYISEFDKNHYWDRGARAAYDNILNYLNTLEDRLVDKSKIYKAVFEMNPPIRMAR